MNLQFFANKNIILHPPKQDGTMDTDTNLYPQTKAENIEGLDAKLATKQDTITQANPLSALNVQVSDVFDTDVDAKAAFGMLKSGKQDTLTAGSGIDITNNVISATGGGGGGATIGGGFEVRGKYESSSAHTFLVLGTANGSYGWQYYDSVHNVMTNCSLFIALNWDADVVTYNFNNNLVAYDGTVITNGNKESYLNKLLYLKGNLSFNESE